MSGPAGPARGGSIDPARIESEIRRILESELGVAAERLAGTAAEVTLLGRGVGLDSMEALVLVTALERAFAFEAVDEEMTPEALATIHSLARSVQSWIARQGAA
jgi:acyl carrier protein